MDYTWIIISFCLFNISVVFSSTYVVYSWCICNLGDLEFIKSFLTIHDSCKVYAATPRRYMTFLHTYLAIHNSKRTELIKRQSHLQVCLIFLGFALYFQNDANIYPPWTSFYISWKNVAIMQHYRNPLIILFSFFLCCVTFIGIHVLEKKSCLSEHWSILLVIYFCPPVV